MFTQILNKQVDKFLDGLAATFRRIDESTQRYSYVECHKKVWVGFEPGGLKYEWIKFNALVEDPDGEYHSNGRKINTTPKWYHKR